MNYLQLCNRLRTNVGIVGVDMTSVTGQTGELQRVTQWVNEAWMDLQAMRQDWMWLRKSVAFPTVANQISYSATQIGISDFGQWARDTFRNYANPVVSISIDTPALVTLAGNLLTAGDTVKFYTTGALPTGLVAGTTYYVVNPTTNTFQVSATAGGAAIATTGTQSGVHSMTSNNTTIFSGMASEIFMSYTEYDRWRNAYEYGALRQVATRPIEITITPLQDLAFGPIADAGYTIVGDYYSVPTELVAATDIPALPTQFHLAIVYKSMLAYGMYESAGEVVQRAQMELDKWMRRIHIDQIKEITTCGPLA